MTNEPTERLAGAVVTSIIVTGMKTDQTNTDVFCRIQYYSDQWRKVIFKGIVYILVRFGLWLAYSLVDNSYSDFIWFKSMSEER